jgi:hypothetical protein
MKLLKGYPATIFTIRNVLSPGFSKILDAQTVDKTYDKCSIPYDITIIIIISKKKRYQIFCLFFSMRKLISDFLFSITGL